MAPREQDERSREGTVVGERYRIVRLLGEGGMGSVYEAENTWTHRRVALKLLLPEHAADGEVAQRFMREARAASGLAHPHIVDVLDMGRDPAQGTLYIVQELLAGVDLRRRLRDEKRLAPRAAADVLAPVMDALAFAHARGVVHRDIKPENIFLAETPGGVTPKLIDFGVSKVLEASAGALLTKAGVVLGTPWYMAPEQAVGDAAIDGRADVWAVGVVLYEALAGRCPFDAPTASLLLVKVVMDDAPRIEQFAPDIPRDLADVVHRALARERSKRFPDMRAFLDALRACALPERPLAGPSAPIERTATAALGASPAAAPPAVTVAQRPASRPDRASLGHAATVAVPEHAPPDARAVVAASVALPPRRATVPPADRRRHALVAALGAALLLLGVLLASSTRADGGTRDDAPAAPPAPPAPAPPPLPVLAGSAGGAPYVAAEPDDEPPRGRWGRGRGRGHWRHRDRDRERARERARERFED